VVVVDVLGIRSPADQADPTLQSDPLVELVGTDAVSPLQVIVTTRAVQAFDGFLAPRVMARLAVRVTAIF
jgi:hypothetical protein